LQKLRGGSTVPVAVMIDQLALFDTPSQLPEGFRYQADLITPEAEHALLAAIRELPFKAFEFHGYEGKRRTVSFGWSYDFSRETLGAAEPLPPFLLALRESAAAFAGTPAAKLRQALVIEYGANAGIGWHRDKEVFDEVVGISLLSSCRFRLRRRTGAGWERVTLDAAPRSAYLLSGPARAEWEHSIPPVETPRYSVTFRSLREGPPRHN
jgi:alkylated DNA repair dioxygenase AlkB